MADGPDPAVQHHLRDAYRADQAVPADRVAGLHRGQRQLHLLRQPHPSPPVADVLVYDPHRPLSDHGRRLLRGGPLTRRAGDGRVCGHLSLHVQLW